jgi:gliding motility-associated-like protein
VVDAGAGYTKYRWSTGDSTQTITVTESGDYVVTVTSPNTCTGEGTKKVIEIPQPNIDWTADSIICKGNTVTLNAGKTGYVHYWWYEVTETNGIQDTTMINPMIQPGDTLPDTTITSMEITKEGRFKVYTRYFEAPFCFDSAETFIREDLYPEIDFGIQRPDTTLCVGETLLLDPNFTGSSSRQVIYEWQDDSEDSIYYARETGLYTLSMTNDCGADIDEVYVTFDDCSNIYIPNTFSPNGDGDNELWGISSLQKFIEFNLEIFDRDGHVIWETNDSKILWDGTHIRSGEPLPIGLYVYKISYRSWFEYIEGVNSAPTRELTGAIHLIR